MSSLSQQQNLRTIYDLLDKLCRNYSTDHHKDILKTATATIADLQQGFLANLSFDESIIASKIKNHLSTTKPDNSLTFFINLHEELATLADPKFRSSVLTLLYLLSDMKLETTNNNKHLTGDFVFSFPNKSRPATSSNFEQFYHGMSSRVSTR